MGRYLPLYYNKHGFKNMDRFSQWRYNVLWGVTNREAGDDKCASVSVWQYISDHYARDSVRVARRFGAAWRERWAGADAEAGKAPQEDVGAAQASASPRGVSPRRLPATPFDLAARVGPVNKASDSLTRSYVKETAPIIKWIIVIIFIMLGLPLSSQGGNSHSRKYYGLVSLLNIYIYIQAPNTQIPIFFWRTI